MSQNVRVHCRIRPQNAREAQHGGRQFTKVSGNTLELLAAGEFVGLCEGSFVFDAVHDVTASQSAVFEAVGRPVVRQVLAGYNATIFAYGQTGSGKTHTMSGSPEDGGVIPRVVQELFESAEVRDGRGVVRLSVLEIYCENVHDLLVGNRERGAMAAASSSKNLRLTEHRPGEVDVEGCVELMPATAAEALAFIRAAEGLRATGSHEMNADSSRSHSVVTLKVATTDTTKDGAVIISRKSTLRLVDLAGSESVKKTQAQGATLDEAKKINVSLSALGNVISALTTGKGHVPYRDSKLTRLLQSSLGGNGYTVLLVACSASTFNGEETLSTLRFGTRAKKVRQNAVVNADVVSGGVAAAEQVRKLVAQVEGERARVASLEARLFDAASAARDEIARTVGAVDARVAAVRAAAEAEARAGLAEAAAVADVRQAALEAELARLVDDLRRKEADHATTLEAAHRVQSRSMAEREALAADLAHVSGLVDEAVAEAGTCRARVLALEAERAQREADYDALSDARRESEAELEQAQERHSNARRRQDEDHARALASLEAVLDRRQALEVARVEAEMAKAAKHQGEAFLETARGAEERQRVQHEAAVREAAERGRAAAAADLGAAYEARLGAAKRAATEALAEASKRHEAKVDEGRRRAEQQAQESRLALQEAEARYARALEDRGRNVDAEHSRRAVAEARQLAQESHAAALAEAEARLSFGQIRARHAEALSRRSEAAADESRRALAAAELAETRHAAALADAERRHGDLLRRRAEGDAAEEASRAQQAAQQAHEGALALDARRREAEASMQKKDAAARQDLAAAEQRHAAALADVRRDVEANAAEERHRAVSEALREARAAASTDLRRALAEARADHDRLVAEARRDAARDRDAALEEAAAAHAAACEDLRRALEATLEAERAKHREALEEEAQRAALEFCQTSSSDKEARRQLAAARDAAAAAAAADRERRAADEAAARRIDEALREARNAAALDSERRHQAAEADRARAQLADDLGADHAAALRRHEAASGEERRRAVTAAEAEAAQRLAQSEAAARRQLRLLLDAQTALEAALTAERDRSAASEADLEAERRRSADLAKRHAKELAAAAKRHAEALAAAEASRVADLEAAEQIFGGDCKLRIIPSSSTTTGDDHSPDDEEVVVPPAVDAATGRIGSSAAAAALAALRERAGLRFRTLNAEHAAALAQVTLRKDAELHDVRSALQAAAARLERKEHEGALSRQKADLEADERRALEADLRAALDRAAALEAGACVARREADAARSEATSERDGVLLKLATSETHHGLAVAEARAEEKDLVSQLVATKVDLANLQLEAAKLRKDYFNILRKQASSSSQPENNNKVTPPPLPPRFGLLLGAFGGLARPPP